ncbi:MAG: carboxypeptidase regulatory-like domain-containing protein [Ignavibacteriales bacterium]|nr:carboxypeptidase regulatory-like domain-containing protein [Ignavibacteriales bacterium]
MKKLTTYIGMIMITLLLMAMVNAQSVPPAPANLTVEQQGNIAKLTWNVSPGASSYRIYKSVDSSPFSLLATPHSANYSDPVVSADKIYRYYVTAINYVGESLPSNDVIFMLNTTPQGFLKGFITGQIVDDSTSQPVGGVRLRFYKTDGFLYFREARTDSLGYYSIHIDTGSYYIYASKWTYQSEWYDNVTDRELATLVPVSSKDTSAANFGLTQTVPPIPPRLISIGGVVTDSTTGNPIKDAFVVIMRSTRQINLIQNQEGHLFGARNETFMIPGFGTLIGVMRVVRTGDDGSYTAWVPDSLSYIMLAFKLGYIPEFYNNKINPYDADRIFPTTNISGINFDLVFNPDAQNSVSGRVKGLSGEGVLSKVVLFRKTTTGVFPLRCAITDTNGFYSFNYLFNEYYYLKAYPFSSYAPAWYSINECGIACWVNADSFSVVGNIADIDVCVQPIIPGGFASIKGSVSELSANSGVQGASVYAVSPVTSTIAGYDITENDGRFNIENLPPGDYQIIVDKAGYTASEIPVYSLNTGNDFMVINADVMLTNITLDVPADREDIPAQHELSQNYPNPFNPSTEIKYQISNISYVTLIVYDILGREATTLVNGITAPGSYTAIWDASAKSNGVYYYRLVVNRGEYQEIKKMILLK